MSDYYSESFREVLRRLEQTPSHITEESQQAEPDWYAPLRQLSRTRISLLLRQLRAVHGLTYAQVQADTGLSQQTLFDVEFKDRRLSLEELRLLAACYKVSVGDILGVDIE